MGHTTDNLTKITKLVIILSFCLAAMYLGHSIFIPLAFAIFIALLLYPAVSLLEKKLSRISSILVTFVVVYIMMSGVVYFFGTQFYHVFQDIKDFSRNLEEIYDQTTHFIDTTIFQSNFKVENFLDNKPFTLLGNTDFIGQTLSTSAGFLASIVLVTVYTFLFLLYRTSFKKLVQYHFSNRMKGEVSEVLNSIQKVSQNYFFGLFIMILILGTLNGLGLLVIGLEYPFLFGYFAALLAIIPYIGTFIGGLLPALYAIIDQSNPWIAVFVVLWYVLVQTFEGNVLTPKIIGSKVSINPLIALIALLTGGLIWGIAGMILFIPFMAILKVIFDHIDSLKPYGLLLGSDFGDEDLPFFKKLSKKLEKNKETE